jgi:hypothetical protein
VRAPIEMKAASRSFCKGVEGSKRHPVGKRDFGLQIAKTICPRLIIRLKIVINVNINHYIVVFSNIIKSETLIFGPPIQPP